MSYLVLKCGSAARGDTNTFSDQDYVCIYHADALPLHLKSKYEDLSFFSTSNIESMKANGSLFIAHLDIEAQIIEGNEELLTLIKGFRPEPLLIQSSRNPTVNFIRSISWYPKTSDGVLWLMDVLYVAFRNILYCENALNGIYSFGFEDAMSSYGLSCADSETFRQIRMGKYAYRSENVKNLGFVGPRKEEIASLSEALSGKKLDLIEGGETNWWSEWCYDYWDERLIERATVNKEIYAPEFMEMLKNHNYSRRSLPGSSRKLVESARGIYAAKYNL
ncbi:MULTISPECIES: hypothetical protein [unclassified Neptuniibacter]|uniref:hypothetical protein n=1 Tax=unclassified Neptuniibacter TaxID=2630693 RepID=UPI000C5B7661|nr:MULTISPECIES: hypothetical protein [unclassified Neptuniibacter]MAY43498.1 hypothetical protein [Oceanospirillaceae bacterium]|tara:strand:+ start:28473 stop:29303 length:831 start_codon:yes stop_codon:yes gene_type:complete